MTDTTTICRYFTTYSGVKLPFKLVSELQEQEIRNRNTYFRGLFNSDGKLLSFEKMVYGDVELAHVYTYGADGELIHAEITDADGETTTVNVWNSSESCGSFFQHCSPKTSALIQCLFSY